MRSRGGGGDEWRGWGARDYRRGREKRMGEGRVGGKGCRDGGREEGAGRMDGGEGGI